MLLIALASLLCTIWAICISDLGLAILSSFVSIYSLRMAFIISLKYFIDNNHKNNN